MNIVEIMAGAQALAEECSKYRAFIERLARKPTWGRCYCAGSIVMKAGEEHAYYEHADDCVAVEARRILGMATDERGNLVED